MSNQNNSEFSSYDFTEYCTNQSYGTLAVFNISFTIIGWITGLFLALIVSKNAALRGDKFLLLNNLLFSSMVLLTITGILYTEEAINPCWYIGVFFCKFFLFTKTFLTNVSTFLLVALAIQQLNRYRRKPDNAFNATHLRWMVTIAVVWSMAVLISVPELVLSRVIHFDEQGIFTLCGIYKFHTAERFTRSAKILFLEYVFPFFVLVSVVVATGFYVFMIRSQYTTFGVTSGESLMTRDLNHPRHFALVVCLTSVYIVGYFPLYSFELASFLEGVAQTGRFNYFWIHMDLVSIFFVLVPPALVPLFIMLFSWPHRDVVRQIYRSMTVTIFEEREPDAAGRGGREEEEEFADVKA